MKNNNNNSRSLNTINKFSLEKDGEELYMKELLKVYKILEDNGMDWYTTLEETMESNYKDEEWCQYVTLSILEMSPIMYLNAMTTTNRLFKLMDEVVDKFYNLDKDTQVEILDDVGFSKFNQDLIINSPRLKLFSYLCRFDLVYDEKLKIHKCIEVNSDTPAGLIESGMVHSVVNTHAGLPIYSTIENALVNNWDNFREEVGMTSDDILYFSALGDVNEDKLTLDYSRLHSENKGKSKFIALEDISITEDGLFDLDNNPIKYLDRYYPVEYWENEVNDLGKLLAEHVKSGKVVIVNPISAFLIQNKNFYTFIYSQLKNNVLELSDDALSTIKDCMLETYSTKDEALLNLNDFVEKPVYGREGNCVNIYKDKKLFFKDIVHSDTEYYDSQDKIYQEYIEMPKVKVETWDGEYEGSLLIGSHVIGGECCGLYIRVGHLVTGNMSLNCSYIVKEMK